MEDEATHTPLGFGWRNLSFPVGALHSESVAVDITITAAFADLAPLIKDQCDDKGYVVFSSSGASAWMCGWGGRMERPVIRRWCFFRIRF